MDSKSHVPGLIVQLKALKDNVPDDELVRKGLLEAARELCLALETPADTIQRLGYCYFQITAARIASDMDLFEALTEKDGSSLSTEELVRLTKTNEAFLGRLLRYLASMGMIKETGQDRFTASNITKTLTIPGLKAGIYHNHDVTMLCSQVLPDFLAESNYQNPDDGDKSPLHRAHRTDQPSWVWLSQNPTRLTNFNLWVGASREGQKTFLDVFPFEDELCHDLNPDTPLFVDVGGGIGHQSRMLKAKLTHVPGRIIVQDLPPVIAQAPATDGIELMSHDFMKEQPIKGARVYYLRNIMHDHADEKAVRILQQIMKAMDRDSVILIDEMIIPNQGTHWRATQLDFAMMVSLAALERTDKQWHLLLDSAGLKIKQICTYTPDLRDSIIMAVPK